MNYHLIEHNKQTTMMGIDIEKFEVIELASCVSEEFNTLRRWIVPSLFETYAANKHHEYPQNIFEIGKVFSIDDKKENKVSEATRLAVGLAGENSDFTRIKQILDVIFDAIGEEYKVKETIHPSFIQGRCARVSVKGVDVAYIGEIHPQVISNWQIEMPVAALELNLSELFEAIKEDLQLCFYRELQFLLQYANLFSANFQGLFSYPPK